MRSSHDLVSWPSSPLQGLMPSQKPLRQSRRDRGVSTYKATYWIQVQTKRTRLDLSSLGAYLYSKKPNRPKTNKQTQKATTRALFFVTMVITSEVRLGKPCIVPIWHDSPLHMYGLDVGDIDVFRLPQAPW